MIAAGGRFPTLLVFHEDEHEGLATMNPSFEVSAARRAPGRRAGSGRSALEECPRQYRLADTDSQRWLELDLVRLWPELLRRAKGLAQGPADAADLVQETCRRALCAKDRPPPGSDTRRWLMRILRNLHIDLVRRARIEPLLVCDLCEIPAREPDAAPLSARVSMLQMERALDAIPAPYRETYELFACAKLSYAAIAQRLAVPPGTVGVRIHRARGYLRVSLCRQMGVEPS